MFFDALTPTPSGSLLDIGGSIGMTGEFSRLYGFFTYVSTLNLEPEAVGSGHATFIRGDACEMPFPSSSFDYVFSNAVIEHVGDFERQRRMANEIARVARKGYFVTTPNRHFPIDPIRICRFIICCHSLRAAALHKEFLRAIWASTKSTGCCRQDRCENYFHRPKLSLAPP